MAFKEAILYGIDLFINQKNNFNNKRIGLVTNNAATTVLQDLSRIALLKAGFTITKFFSPEHGISATGEDGVFQQNHTDELTGLPVISLYAGKLIPNEQDLSTIDILVFDLSDIGCRFYTYQWTLSYIMEACNRYNKPLIVLDRPNPLNGNLSLSEGPMLDEQYCSSFIGRWDIPVRHSLTIGELAGYWNKARQLNIDLTVITCKGWNRNLFFDDLNIPFVPTSPAITDFETALLYPGTGLLEGINVSEGRGTKTPFKICGAPFIDAVVLNNTFNKLELPGIKSKSVSFVPLWSKYENQTCHGIELTITGKQIFKPVQTGLLLINLLMNLYPEQLKPHLYKTVANPGGENHLDKLTGIKNSWGLLSVTAVNFKNEIRSMTKTENWAAAVKDFLLY